MSKIYSKDNIRLFYIDLSVGRLTSETKEKLKIGYVQRLFMVVLSCSSLSQDATEVYMMLHR
jgi:hypothetical protein